MTGFKLREALDLDGDQDWRDHAACATLTVDTPRDIWAEHDAVFHPRDRGAHHVIAKRICARCPVKAQCLEYALAYEAADPGSRYGVYGGLSPAERERLANGAA